MFKRTEESKFTSWYFEIDTKLLWSVLILFLIGAFAMVSAGSVAAERTGRLWDFFILKALPYYAIGLVTLFGASALNKKWAIKISALNVIVCLGLLLVTFLAPNIINGSARFITFGSLNIMPADVLKPGFIFITAWFLSQMKLNFGDNIFTNKSAWKFKLISWWSYLLIVIPMLAIIFNHPDVGTFVLYFLLMSAMFFIAGLPLILIPVLGAALIFMGTLAFFTMGHVHNRIVNLWHGTGDNFQTDQSIQSIQHGGLFGRGEDAFVKQSLPDAHTDFVFSALAEDLGAIAVCVLLCFLFYILNRLVNVARGARDPFVFYATGGAAALFGLQTCINITTSLHLFATKGMTLPFVSYGGSSFVSFCLLFGMILAIVREDIWK